MPKCKTSKIIVSFTLVITILLHSSIHTPPHVYASLPDNVTNTTVTSEGANVTSPSSDHVIDNDVASPEQVVDNDVTSSGQTVGNDVPPLDQVADNSVTSSGQTVDNDVISSDQVVDDITPLEQAVAPTTFDAGASLEISAHEIIVFSYEALVAALQEDNGYTIFYLGNNITATTDEGITIHSSKETVTIDGKPPGETSTKGFIFKQYHNHHALSTIHVEEMNTTIKNITFQNLTISGNNVNGVIRIPESVLGVTTLFQNVNYTGPQAITNQNGTARFIDCDLTMSETADIQLSDLAEANHVEIGGTSDINSSSTASLLLLTNSNVKFCILENANVTVNINGYFFHSDSESPDIWIHPNALFSVFNDYGFTHPGANIKNFLIEEDASVMLTQTFPFTFAALRIAETFEVKPGGDFWLLRMQAGVALYFPLSGGRAIFNDPKRIFLYSPTNPSIVFEDRGTLEIRTTSMNIWYEDKVDFGPPSYFWNDLNNELFSITAHYLGDTTLSVEHSLSDNTPTPTPLDAASFDLPTTILMVFGHATLDVNPIYTRSDTITGYADKDASISVQYTSFGGQKVSLSGNADSTGYFSIPVNRPFTLNEVVTIESSIASMTTRAQLDPIELPNEHLLAFSSVPEYITFTEILPPFSPTTFSRDDEDFSLSVIDTRVSRSPWQVEVSLSSPLTAELPSGPHVLHNALVFVDEAGNTTPLTKTPFTVYTNQTSLFGEFKVSWDATEGILLHAIPGQTYSKVSYTATLQWSLVDAP
jgi:hypothetical protein